MPDITFILADGSERGLEAPEGVSVMAAATGAGVPGIVAECGGSAMCATCHVYVDPAWLAATGARTEMEQSMLSFAAAAQHNSRLACQIVMSDALAGIVLRLPDGQH